MRGSPGWVKNPPARALRNEPLLPSWLQQCDLLAALPRRGPWQEEFKHPQEKPPAIDPHIRLPEPSQAFIKEPERRGHSSPFLPPFFCLPSHFPPPPGCAPSPRSLGELAERQPCRQRWRVALSAALSCRSLSRLAPGGRSRPLRAPSRLSSKSLEVGEMELEREVRRSPSRAGTGSSTRISVDLGLVVFIRAH